MKIAKNTSAFDTRWLRTLFCKVHRVQAKTEGPCKVWKRLKVTVGRRGPRSAWRSTSGHAYVGTGPIHLSLLDTVTTRNIARVFWHEMMHVYGYRSHRGGRCDPHSDYLDQICEGLPETPVLKQPAAKKPTDIVKTRYERILTRQAQWQKKFDRAKKALEKATRERREYERRHNGRIAA